MDLQWRQVRRICRSFLLIASTASVTQEAKRSSVKRGEKEWKAEVIGKCEVFSRRVVTPELS